MEPKIYGYIRVSSKDQNEDRQLDAFATLHIPIRQTYIDNKMTLMEQCDMKRTAFTKHLKEYESAL